MKYLPTAQPDISSNLASLEIHFSVLVFHHRNWLVSEHEAGQSRLQLKLILPVGTSVGEGLTSWTFNRFRNVNKSWQYFKHTSKMEYFGFNLFICQSNKMIVPSMMHVNMSYLYICKQIRRLEYVHKQENY